MRLVAALALLLAVCASAVAAPDCPDGDRFPAAPLDRAAVERAIAAVAGDPVPTARPTGIVVPHHAGAADHLIARGFAAAGHWRYRRVVLIAPDHFRRAGTAFATTRKGFDTPYGSVDIDQAAVASLIGDGGAAIEESCLFAREHSVQALLPYLKRALPDAQLVPVVISVRTTKADWDRLAELLAPLLDAETLVVESTDFSHYLPHHQARQHDQQTLNLIAAGEPAGIASLTQPDHADSVSALYVQTRLQAEVYGAVPLVVANENLQQYSTGHIARTTSYMVILYAAPQRSHPDWPGSRSIYLAGDTFFGRSMTDMLLDPERSERVASDILGVTRGRPLVVNLEGTILGNVPDALAADKAGLRLAMPEELVVPWLSRLSVAGAGLANNHALDFGEAGLAETRRVLDAASIPHFGQGELLPIAGLDIVGLSDLGINAGGGVDLIDDALLDRLVRPDPTRPVIAFVHWGREYDPAPSPRETALAQAMRKRGVAVIAGAHPHVASEGLAAIGGGDTLVAHSLGNFLFDQGPRRSSGALLELRAFEQGTVFARWIAVPTYFDRDF